ncbi:membrane protein [Christiangramia forsetii KT0803]|uniref:Membrane protein n=3 Tax=Christiangramia forsetii TaxID=411153 RepID=A0LZX1_CHRFK|nr:hypothetical protein GCM10011532_33020 [Christiangramia forsetii]CAL65916.1 membrane protein [Christiangramia forsetii KT0803]
MATSKEKMSNKEYELILGILCLILSFILLYIEIKDWLQIDKKDYMRKSYKIEIITGAAIFMITGITGIYRYFK